MGLRDSIRATARRLRERRRRVWQGDGRLWVELRGMPGAADRLGGVIAALEANPAVRWVRFNGPFQRLVVTYEGDADAVMDAVRAAEAAAGLADAPFAADPPRHPGDTRSRDRSVLRAAANVTSVAVGASLQLSGLRTGAVEIDLAALSQALENLPQARKWLDRRIGGSRSDLVLGLMGSATSALAKGTTGQAVDLVYRGLRLAEIRAQRGAWARREAELAGSPDAHDAEAPDLPPRPEELPKGPIEQWSEKAGLASLGGFGFGVAATGHAEEAVASIVGAVPKPARVGREAFGAALAISLTERGIVVTDNRPLRRLDRVDLVVLPGSLVAPSLAEVADVLPLGRAKRGEVQIRTHRLLHGDDPHAERTDGGFRLAPLGEVPQKAEAWAAEQRGRRLMGLWRDGRLIGLVALRSVVEGDVRRLVARVRELDLELAVATDDPEAAAWLHPDRVLPSGDALVGAIRELQDAGRGVLLFADGPSPALGAADVSLALHRPGQPPPWGAHLIAGPSPADIRLLLDAVEAARRASRQAVAVSAAEAAAGLTMALQDQNISTVRRIMAASGLLSAVAGLNGVRVARQVSPMAWNRSDRTPWHALQPDEALRRLDTGNEGLTDADAYARRVPDAPTRTWAQEFGRAVWREVASPFAPILATGAGLSALVGSPVDAGLVLGTVLAGGLVAGWQQANATQAMRHLEGTAPSEVAVRRGGRVLRVDPDDLVLGDVIELDAGDRVPADCRILGEDRLEVDESSLTGESVPVQKGVDPCFERAIADRRSMLWADTTIAAGSAVAVVVAVGAETQARRAMQHARAGAATGVHQRLQQLTDLTGPVAAGAGLAVIASGVIRNRPAKDMVDAAVSMAVAAVPETLPLLATAAQLAAARRLSERGALVQNASAVEALGRVDVLCADKTGTLTEGILRLQAVSDGLREAPLDALDDVLRGILEVALLATPGGADDPVPHPTDRALLDGAGRAGVTVSEWTRVSELPFEPARGYHATIAERGGRLRLAVKGAPEVVIPLCDRIQRDGATRARRVEDGDHAALLQQAVSLAGEGYRVLAVAERGKRGTHLRGGARVRHLVFRGFVAIADPVRQSAPGALDALRAAGIDVVMITGDHPATARAIAAQLGLPPEVLTGPELERLDDDSLAEVLQTVRVFARVTPQLKVRIVAALQARGRVVAMTGDGANDAPAIRLADAGIALGQRATAAARGASDVWVTDERIETIVDAVLEGRAMWASVRDAVSVLLGGNLGELGFTLVGGLLQGQAPLGARQLMLVNLLTDALPALTIAVRPPGHTTPEKLMGEGPERSLGTALNRDIAWRAVVTGSTAMGAWLAARPFSSRERAGTVALLSLVGSQLGQTLAVGWRNPPVVAAAVVSGALLVGLVQTPGLSHLSGSRPLGPVGLTQAGVAVVVGTAAGVVLPPLARWLDERYDLTGRVVGATDGDWGRFVAESRTVRRIIEDLEAPDEGNDDETEREQGDGDAEAASGSPRPA